MRAGYLEVLVLVFEGQSAVGVYSDPRRRGILRYGRRRQVSFREEVTDGQILSQVHQESEWISNVQRQCVSCRPSVNKRQLAPVTNPHIGREACPEASKTSDPRR